MKVLSRDDILQARDVKIEQVDVPEWEGIVYVRSISAGERGMIEEAAAKFKESKGKDPFARNFTVKFASLALCDETGKRLFRDEDIALLQQKNAAAVSRVAEAAQRLSGFSKSDMEELEKNLKDAQAEGLPSV
jgi:hypothetical protein